MVVTAATFLLLLRGPKATAETLAGELRAHPVPNALVVAPETVRRAGKGSGLAAFGRKVVRLGALNAVVPTTVVAFDDALAQPPNLYDGLPRDAKALYLLTLLTPGQRRLAAGRGLSLDDLQGEPRAVLDSLLPQRLAWSKRRTGREGEIDTNLGSGTVEGEARRGIRLRFVQAIGFDFAMVDEPNASSSTTTVDDRGEPGHVWAERDFKADEDRQGDVLYGLRLRQTVENRPKKGALDLRRLDVVVTLKAGGTVGDALAAIGAKTTRELLADLRVRDLKVAADPGPIRTGDLLGALALAVGGTYRKVGGAFLLTADEMGMGVREARMKAWEEGVGRLIRRKEREWKESIRTTKALEEIGFAPGDALKPDDALTPYLDHTADTKERYAVSESMLSPAQRGFLRRFQGMYRTQKFALDRVGVDRFYTFGFVLPDGTPLNPERMGLGFGAEFRQYPSADSETPPPTPPIALAPGAPTPPLMVATELPGEAARAVAEAKAHGLREVWLETRSATALAEALKGGVALRLVSRPWRAPQGTPTGDLDRTLTGDDGATFAGRVAKEPQWLDEEGKPFRPASPLVEIFRPESPSWTRAAAGIAELARTPGLAGVVLLETQPHGYEGRRTNAMSPSFPSPFAALSAFGWAESARLAFLRRHGVDPIDLGWTELRGTIDARPSFFADRNLSHWASDNDLSTEPPALGALLAAWDLDRAAANVAAVRGLLAKFPALPIEIEERAIEFNLSRWGIPMFRPWAPGADLPVRSSDGARVEDGRFRLTVEPDGSAIFLPLLLARLLKEPVSVRPVPTLDLSGLPPAEWAPALDRLFRRAAP